MRKIRARWGVMRLISEEEVAAIVRVLIGSAAASDRLIWRWEKSRKYTVKLGYHWLRGRSTRGGHDGASSSSSIDPGINGITTLNGWFHDILFHDGLGKVDRAQIASSLAFTCWTIWKSRCKAVMEGYSPSPMATVIASSSAISDFSRAKAHIVATRGHSVPLE
ncbi:PREDICTED: reverse mRNAase [Prunus dulcis]|uniref:PREDICTED: reverse mRNAase n=1 Tax=Prunus dulcis TaxID=3755 RepID=A0A5E4FZG8_PRUDU|nr:PREDICTED: reverse mRNAase [Prunus dulcis]